jgi:hypothetical protein
LIELPEAVVNEMEFIFAEKIQYIPASAIPRLTEQVAALRAAS